MVLILVELSFFDHFMTEWYHILPWTLWTWFSECLTDSYLGGRPEVEIFTYYIRSKKALCDWNQGKEAVWRQLCTNRDTETSKWVLQYRIEACCSELDALCVRTMNRMLRVISNVYTIRPAYVLVYSTSIRKISVMVYGLLTIYLQHQYSLLLYRQRLIALVFQMIHDGCRRFGVLYEKHIYTYKFRGFLSSRLS